jgi:hypothetical protein
MKCTCGYERMPGSVLCRMVEGAGRRFVVRIYLPDGRLMAESEERLTVESALDFVQEKVSTEGLITHFHWEERPATQLRQSPSLREVTTWAGVGGGLLTAL